MGIKTDYRSRWADVRSLLGRRPKTPSQEFNNRAFVVRPEADMYCPAPNFADRLHMEERFMLKPFVQRTCVTFSASVALAEMQAYVQANKSFAAAGTNVSNDDVTFNSEGGLRLETDGAAADCVYFEPIAASTGCAAPSAWGNTNWGSENELWWGGTIATTSTISATTLWAGLKLTYTHVVATDADQAFFRFSNAQGTKWNYAFSVSGTDYTGSIGPAVAASKIYHLKIIIDSSRKPTFIVQTGATMYQHSATTALTTGKNFTPYIGVYGGAGAAKSCKVYGMWMSRNIQ